MNAKSILIGSALLFASIGTAEAFNGYGNCLQRGPGMQGRGQNYQMQGNMNCMQPMHRWCMHGQGRMHGMYPSPMRGVLRLNDLTSEQLRQLDSLRQEQQEWRKDRQQTMLARRDELIDKLNAILTEEQRQTLERWNQPVN